MLSRRDLCSLIAGAPLAAVATALAPDLAPRRAAASVPGFVATSGRQFLAADGQALLLKGINLGNWLVPEGYMFGFEVARSPRAIYATFERLLGPDQSAAFWRTFRENFIRREDIDFIAAAGFNTVRVPLHYAMFVDGPSGQVGEGRPQHGGVLAVGDRTQHEERSDVDQRERERQAGRCVPGACALPRDAERAEIGEPQRTGRHRDLPEHVLDQTVPREALTVAALALIAQRSPVELQVVDQHRQQSGQQRQ